MTVEIWHNPRCSKSRTTLKLLQDNGVEPTVRLYLQDAPSKAEIEAALSALGIPAIDLVRTGEAEFRASGLTKDSPDAPAIRSSAMIPQPPGSRSQLRTGYGFRISKTRNQQKPMVHPVNPV